MTRKDVAAPRLPLNEEIPRPTFRRERAALKRGVWPVAGCDEAGRGPLAGPVVAAAVILDPDNVPRGLDDSKRLTAERREVLYERICARAQVAVAMAPPWRIDRDNILRASLWALARAVAGRTQVIDVYKDPMYLATLQHNTAPFAQEAVAGQDNSAMAIKAPAGAGAEVALAVPKNGTELFQAVCTTCHGTGLAGGLSGRPRHRDR